MATDTSQVHSPAENKNERAPVRPRRDELIEEARDMYGRGLSKAEIARRLGVAPNTVWRWCRYDRRRGVSWEALRERACHPDEEKVLGVLTDKQRKKLVEMKGKKFELDRSQFFRPRRSSSEGGGANPK